MEATLRTHVIEIPLRERFAISSASWDVAENVFVTVENDGLMGAGEVCTDPRYGDTAESITGQLEGVSLDLLQSPFDLEGLDELLPAGTARCALDIALHDLAAQRAGISLEDFLGLAGRPRPPTSLTIPISTVEHMQARAREWADQPIIKMKVGFEGDVAAVAAIRDVFPGRIRIDANEGWTRDVAIDKLNELAHFDIELCEQPIPAGCLEELGEVTKASPIPVFADEDVNVSEDVVRLAGVTDGVNLKLRKTGGIREALRAVHVARAVGLTAMLGCDLESGVGTTAQATLASLFDHVDIDGPFAMTQDPFPGVAYDKGHLLLPDGPGLGLLRRPT